MTYYQRHKEIMLARSNARNKTPEGRKKTRIANWIKYDYEKNIGITWDEIYEKYINKTTCEECNVLFVAEEVAYSLAKRTLTKENKIICWNCSHYKK